MQKNKAEIPKISIVIGTRAQLIKMAPVIKELQNRKVLFELIFTNQHTVTMEEISKDFGLKSPDSNFFSEDQRKETKSIKIMTGWFFRSVAKIFITSASLMTVMNGGVVLVHGDTNSCWLGALLGKLRRNKVMHIESGLRSYHLLKPFPEEINRLITFFLADIYVCPNDWACRNLSKFNGVKINTKANTQYDAIMIALAENKDRMYVEMPRKNYVVFSIHRYESVFKREKLEFVVEVAEEIAKKIFVVFVLYPVTEKRLIQYGLFERLGKNINIKLQKRLPFFDYIRLQVNSDFVVTDGGSIQEELSYIGKPTLLLRDVTERIEGIDKTTVVSYFDRTIIEDFMENYKLLEKPVINVEMSPSRMIVDWLVDNGYAVAEPK